MFKHDQTIILASYYFFLQIFMNVKISWSIDCNIGAWGVVQSVQFGEPSLRDRESMRVHYWPDLLFNISSPEKTKQGGSVCMGWGTNYVFRTNWQLSRPSIKGRILVSYNFYVLLCFRSQWLMHYHVTLISSDIFRSKWKRSLFVDFLHWAEQITNSGVPAWGYYQDLPTRNAISARRQIW